MMGAMELPVAPDAVVFDNDGLLLDTESVWTRAEEDLFERRGLVFTPADKRVLVGTSAEIAGGILEQRLGEPGRAEELIEELNVLVTPPDAVYSHKWKPGECMVWDNRCLLHRATGFDTVRHSRVMRRCTINGDKPY